MLPANLRDDFRGAAIETVGSSLQRHQVIERIITDSRGIPEDLLGRFSFQRNREFIHRALKASTEGYGRIEIIGGNLCFGRGLYPVDHSANVQGSSLPSSTVDKAQMMP